ncbi:MAG: MFS transporter [Desulfobacterales bacterium]
MKSTQNPLQQKSPPPSWLSWSIWGLGALLYLFGFYQRVAPAVMTAELMHDFNLGAAALGHLSAVYFYSYVAMQVPTGILVDTWGAHRLLTLGAGVAGAGSLIFAMAPTGFWAGAGRLLIGGSVAVAWVGMLKLANHWFAPRRFAFVSGVALLCGVVGAVAAGVPLRMAVDSLGWRPVMLSSSILAFVVCAGIWWIVRDDPSQKGYRSYAPANAPHRGRAAVGILAGIGEVLRYPNTWLLFVIPGGIVGCVLTFSGLWGVPFLVTHHHLSETGAAGITSMLLVAWALGSPVFGALSDRIGRRKLPYLLGCAVAAVGWGLILLAAPQPLPWLVFLTLVTGFASGCMIISFAYAKESVPPDLTGTVSGLINMGVIMGPTLLQPAVGVVLDRRWNGQVVNGARVYDLPAFRGGFSLMFGWIVLAFILLFFTRETNCRQVVMPSNTKKAASR